jgi:iturin family lipopeptide synthetase A
MHQQPIAYTRMDLTLTANLRGDKVNLECDFNTDLFQTSTIEGFLNSYLNILETVVNDPEIQLNNIPLLSSKDSHVQLIEWNSSERKPNLVDVARQWEQEVETHPDRIALISLTKGNECTLTYQELNQYANQLAHHLIDLGLTVDQKVGICLKRSWEMVAALLACLKAGVAYVPLDPNYPQKRLEYILSDSQVKLVITNEILLKNINLGSLHYCCIDSDANLIQSKNKTNPRVPFDPQNLAYVIYTSGSTGHPKGAMITHEGLSNYLTWAKKAYQAEQGDGSPVLGSFSFDATITSIFLPLVAGNQVVLMPDGDDLEALSTLNQSPYEYSFIKITPAHLELLNSLRQTDRFSNHHLSRSLVLGGEALLGSSMNPWLQDGKCSIINEYGPTETVVGCCILETKTPMQGTVPIGKPIDGMRLYVLDEQMQLLPPGVAGDLYIGGLGLARGYLDRPSQTASSFIPDPFSAVEHNPGARLYRTGDRARYQANGDLVFLGRNDKQVKLYGYRIELGEIEACFSQIPNVKEVNVIIREDKLGSPKLVAYYTSNNQEPIAPEKLRIALKEQIPEYMVPTVLIHLLEMPLSSHGKVDTSALPVPGFNSPETAEVSLPAGKIQEEIATAWIEALGSAQINQTDNFFDIGGNSLLILQVFKKLEHILPSGCQVIDLFKYPTIQSLAQFITNQTGEEKVESDKVLSRVAKQRAATLEKANRQKASLQKNRKTKSIEVE